MIGKYGRYIIDILRNIQACDELYKYIHEPFFEIADKIK